jgi:diacylglycerol kinase
MFVFSVNKIKLLKLIYKFVRIMYIEDMNSIIQKFMNSIIQGLLHLKC